LVRIVPSGDRDCTQAGSSNIVTGSYYDQTVFLSSSILAGGQR
jgi:hypothetical protein